MHRLIEYIFYCKEKEKVLQKNAYFESFKGPLNYPINNVSIWILYYGGHLIQWQVAVVCLLC